MKEKELQESKVKFIKDFIKKLRRLQGDCFKYSKSDYFPLE